MANKAIKYRLHPTEQQAAMFAKFFGCMRFVYNYYLDKENTQYEADKTYLSYAQCAKDLAELKKKDEYSFLKEVDSIALQQALKHLDTGFQNFFKRPDIGHPNFKSKKGSRNSYTTINVNNNIIIEDGYIKLPKIGKVAINQHRAIPSGWKRKSVTVSQTPTGKYFVSILFEYENQVQEVETKSFLGLDFSMHELYVDSNGNEANYPRFYRQMQKNLQRNSINFQR